MDLDAWLRQLQHRHHSAFTSAEFLKALRALSARYVERRSQLPSRSPLDSAGKRAAFAAFYAPMHLLTVREIVRRLEPTDVSTSAGARASGSPEPGALGVGPQRHRESRAPLASIIDLGCGTGVASAAWALAQHPAPTLLGLDNHPWALDEARWNWSQLGLRGDVRRADLVRGAERLLGRRSVSLSGTGLIAGWSVNELESTERQRLLAALLEAGDRGAAILVVEPIARSIVPWWDGWAKVFAAAGGRADEWKFDVAPPDLLAAIGAAAGFRRGGLAARSLYLARQ